MENLEQKTAFLRSELIPALEQLDADAPRKWGKMNVQQMIEHMSAALRIANGRTPATAVLTPEENIPRMQAFLASDKPFKENTPNQLLPDEPAQVKYANKEYALNELQEELDHFFAVHKDDADRKTANAFFGHLNYEQQVQLLYKHATHHLRQFGVGH